MLLKRFSVLILLAVSAFTFASAATSTATCISLSKNHSKGSENSEVLTLQQFLFDGGYLKTQPNGYFGLGTVTAVKRFQIANGISPVGSIGPATRGKVKEVSCSKKGTALTVKTMQQAIQSTSTNSTQIISSESQWLEEKVKGDYLLVRATSPYLEIISKKFAYTAAVIDEKGEEKRFIVYDGKEVGKEYDATVYPVSIGGKLAYTALKNNKVFVVYDGKEIGKEYNSARNPADIGGRLLYFATKDDKYFLVYDGKEYDSFVNTEFLDVNGALAYMAIKDGKKFIVYNGKEIGKEYDEISSMLVLDGKLAYIAQVYPTDNILGKSFIVYDGKEIGKEYDLASELSIYDGKFLYTATRIISKDKYKPYDIKGKSFVVYDGKEIGKEYDNASFPISIGGKLAYIAEKDNKSFVVFDGKKISDQYDSVLSIQSIGEKLVYYVKNNDGGKNKFFIVYDGKKIGEKYDTSLPPINDDGRKYSRVIL
jgi:hypothetical protein